MINGPIKIEVQTNDLDLAVDDSLTPKQILFVEEFTIDFNGTQAAIRAGYSKQTAAMIASENLRKPYIQIAIKARLQNRVSDSRVKQQWVIDELVKKYYEASEAVPILDAQGEKTGTWKCDRLSAIRCLELLGKHLGMFNGESQQEAHQGKVVILPSNDRNSPNLVN